MIDTLLSYLNHDLFPWLVSLLLSLFAFSLWFYYRFYLLAPITQQIKTAVSLINEVTKDDFADKFEQINLAVQDIPVLKQQWYLFQQSLTHTEVGAKQYFYSQAPAYFFNSQKIIAPRINLRFYQTVPNLLVQIGLFFTFLGLLVALYAVSAGLISNELSLLRESLHTLLAAATFKFSTSLTGIGCGIIFSWREKKQWYLLQQLLYEFNSAIEQKMLVTPHKDEQALFRSKQLDQINQNMQISTSMGFSSIKKEIQHLQSVISIASRRLYKAIHHVAKMNDSPITKIEKKGRGNG